MEKKWKKIVFSAKTILSFTQLKFWSKSQRPKSSTHYEPHNYETMRCSNKECINPTNQIRRDCIQPSRAGDRMR